MNSLDPRVKRLPELSGKEPEQKRPLDQLCTYEVFVQPREGKPFQHEGAVHASDLEIAFVLAKETFTRRFTCAALWVVATSDVYVSITTEGGDSVYNLISDSLAANSGTRNFEVFHLPKRGKQHVHSCTVEAASPEQAMVRAREFAPANNVFYNIWAIESGCIRRTGENEGIFWDTLPEKKFRDAAAYKGGDKLKEFLERKKQ